MLGSNQGKQISKADLEKKAEAWKVINTTLVQMNSEFMKSLTNMLIEKETQKSQIEEKLKSEQATEEENAEYLFLGGYTQCLKDILNAKKKTE